MLKKRSGLAIVETILVLAISGLLFAIVIGTFSTRRRAAVDDAARQVMSEIARVRNQAQQGYTGASPAGGQELFGKAIVISSDTGVMTVKNLQQNMTTRAISTYGTDTTINMPSQLRWYINTSSATFNTDGGNVSCVGPSNNLNFNSCNLTTGAAGGGYLTTTSYWLVFRNNTGDSYLMTGTDYTNETNYNTAKQPNVRFAFAQPASGTVANKFKNASAKYYANFELAIPNNQSLTVVK